MESRYKIIIYNKNIFKEIEIASDVTRVKVGTGAECDYRLRKDMFFEPIEIVFSKTEDTWSAFCSDNLYITVGDVRKLITKNLTHGENIEIKYQNSDNNVFFVEFIIDFDSENRKYNKVISLTGTQSLSIGSKASNNIYIRSQYVKNDDIVLENKKTSATLTILNTTYGIYHNGMRAQNHEEIKNGDFFSIADFFFYYKDGKIYTENREDMIVTGLHYIDLPDRNSYPKFNRNTRVKSVVNEEEIEILDPPNKPEKPKNNLLMRFLPSMGMLLTAGVMAAYGGRMIIMSAISGVMAIITTILGIREGNKEFKKQSEERIVKYEGYIDKKKKDIEQFRDEEKAVLEEIYISQNTSQKRLETFSSELFDRTKEDEDFLSVHLGTGSVEAQRKINYKKQEKFEADDELQNIPEQICEEYKYISDAPIVCSLKDINAIGVVGKEKYRFEIMKNMVVDIISRQYFSDVGIAFVADEEHKNKMRWLRRLPYVYSEDLSGRMLVCDDESKNIVFEYLYKELTARENNKKYDKNLVVFFYDDYGFKNHPISKFVEKAKDLGVVFVFFGDAKADIPQGCAYIIDIKDGKTAELLKTEDKNSAVEFEYSSISDKKMEELSTILAPVYTEEISLESSLTKNISMFELLDIMSVDDIDLEQRWKKSQVFKSMAAPIGVSKSSVINLDLHDKYHGPHGLVAGTTGSGKSEILQTYILSMATLYHPYEIGFVIIDFKGGGMVNQFRDLPHLVGAITNIDGKEINRSLKSIKAELQKRQRLFAESEVNHIDKYIKKFKAGEVSEPLPHLIIIVDEFAELKAEQPEFMKELISAARIGRSLGVHLILATQKPSGQVNEQIWSNSKFKLCLKVQSQEDSNEVIKSPLAAEIKEPGRAYLQVGNNEIFELFQSAYSGAQEKSDGGKQKEFAIFSITDSGKRVPVFAQKKNSESGGLTQLEAIVNYVHDFCEARKIRKLPDICLPSLEHSIDFAALPAAYADGKIIADIGVYDDPENQYQGAYSIDISSENVMLIGSAQTGKTNVLQNIIRSVASKYTPDEVTIYVLDFGSMVLKNFEKLNHVGGVVCASEDEKLKNLFKLLNTEIEARKEKLMSLGVSSYSAYREAGKTDIPQIILMIDNLTALKELYFQDDDVLLNICREGLSVGISIIIANAQTAGIGYKYLSNFSSRIAMYCNDSGEYGSLFDHCRERIDNIPGRSIIKLEGRLLECQTYLAFKGEKEIDRVKEIKQFIAETNSKNKDAVARRIPVIPATLTDIYIAEEFANYMQNRFRVVMGLDYATVTPCIVDFAALGLLAITGREKSGKHNWLKYSINMLEEQYSSQLKVYAVDSINKKLSFVKDKAVTEKYTFIAEDAAQYVKEIEATLKQRYDALVSGDESVLANSELLMLVLDNQDAINAICNDVVALAAYKNIVGRYKNMNVCIIAYIENANIPYSAPEIYKNVRDQHHILCFEDLASVKVFDVPLSNIRKYKKPIELGDGYYMKDNECVKLKTPISVK